MTTQVRNVDQVIVGSSNTTAIASIYSMNDLADGDIRLFTVAGKPIGDNAAGGASADATANMKFVIAVGDSGNKPYFVSEVIDGSKISVVRSRAYTAATEQLDYIGYNGTSGSIQAIDDNYYFATVYIEDYLRSSHDGRYNKHFFYESDSSALQSEIAIGLADSGVDNFSKEVKNSGNAPIIFSAICDVAASATNDFDNNATITKGSKTFTVATNLQYNTGGGTLAVGDYLRVAAALNGTLALTDSVYKVTAINSLTVTVDRPIVEPSGTWTDAGDGLQVIPAATGNLATTNWGVKLAGQTLGFAVGKEFYKKMRWSLSLKDFGTTTLTEKSTAATEGSGVPNQVIQHEWFCNGFKGEIYRMGEPTIHSFTAKATTGVTGSGYDVTRITYQDDTVSGFVTNISPKVITIVSPATAPAYMTDTTANGGVWNSLEVIAGTGKCTGVTAAGVEQAGDLNV